jgi:hypothetical protein
MADTGDPKQTMTFTAKQIADALGLKRQAVQWHLRAVTPAPAPVVVNGNEAAAWELAQLPAAIRARLEVEAGRQRCRTIEALLTMPRTRWEPPMPLDKICDADIQAATKLRAALLPWLYRQHDARLTSAEMDAAGAADYERVFGNSITTRYWREVFTRTIRRDNGFEEWNRLEIYLPDKPKPKAFTADVVSEAMAEDFTELEQHLAACGNPHDPSETERNGIWTLALDKYAELVRTGQSDKAAGRRVREFLFARAKFLAPTRNALRMAFDRKLERLQASAGDVKALRDGREGNGESFQLPENDRDLLVHRAVFTYRGDIAPAWRELLRGGKFSPEVLQRYKAGVAKKSYVPASVMDSVGPEVEILTVMHQGPRAFDAIKGHVTRSYDGISSLKCLSADDGTVPVYFYIPDGNGWFALTRGQVILFIDFRTLCIVGWALEPHKSYSSLTIRSLCTHIFAEYGVPDVLYFERGIWKSANLLQGKTDPFTFAEISQGLREFGVKFKHAIRPRTKAIERVWGMFQDIAEAEPGYCGRDERRDAPETLRKQMAEVEARKVHPSKYFYSQDQWNQRIGQLVEQYNAADQEGHILAGMSPDRAFEAYKDKENPPMQFSAALRYLLAHDKRLLPVTLNGVTVQVGKRKFNYRGQEISHLVGRKALVWFDPENPETAVVTNPDRTNPICVSRSESPNALESIIVPESGILKNELARIEGQASYPKTRYNVVKAKFALPSRLLLNAAPAVELGEQIAARQAEHSEAATRRQQARSRAQKIMRETGIAVSERTQGQVTDAEIKDLNDFLKGKDNKP